VLYTTLIGQKHRIFVAQSVNITKTGQFENIDDVEHIYVTGSFRIAIAPNAR